MLLALGDRSFDLCTRALVMAIVNVSPESARGYAGDLDELLRRAEQAMADGADILDVGGASGAAEPPSVEVELERAIPAVEALTSRFDVAVSIDTARAAVAEAAFAAGAVLGNDVSGFSDPGYLPAAANAGASVIACAARPSDASPEPADPDPVVAAARSITEGVRRAEDAGVPIERIAVDPALGLGWTVDEDLALLAGSTRLAALGRPVVLSASHKAFLDVAIAAADGGTPDRADATTAATALGVARGCRIVRAHDVRAARRACDVLAAIQGAR